MKVLLNFCMPIECTFPPFICRPIAIATYMEITVLVTTYLEICLLQDYYIQA